MDHRISVAYCNDFTLRVLINAAFCNAFTLTAVTFNLLLSCSRLPHVQAQRHDAHPPRDGHHPDRLLRGRRVDQALLRLRRREHLDDDLHSAILRVQERQIFLQVSLFKLI